MLAFYSRIILGFMLASQITYIMAAPNRWKGAIPDGNEGTSIPSLWKDALTDDALTTRDLPLHDALHTEDKRTLDSTGIGLTLSTEHASGKPERRHEPTFIGSIEFPGPA
ncbi:hypothetical protein PENSPDRAFT_753170 [Peniophora sp. CONT]|nr:hypothetical protein PENSPDRAFT_753170 [Peniophora sp. CONT]